MRPAAKIGQTMAKLGQRHCYDLPSPEPAVALSRLQDYAKRG